MIVPFGKYKGWELEQIPSGYLRWLAENCNDESIAEEADNEWTWRETWGKHFEV
jgi:hypothetical protein